MNYIIIIIISGPKEQTWAMTLTSLCVAGPSGSSPIIYCDPIKIELTLRLSAISFS